MMRRVLVGLARVAGVLIYIGCGSDSQRDESTGTRPDNSVASAGAAGPDAGDSAIVLPCTEEEWSRGCELGCPFEPADIDCVTACLNLSTVCEANCPPCMGMTLDPETCMVGCTRYRELECFNRLLGCFQTSTTCEAQSSCADSKRSVPRPSGRAGSK